MTNPQDTERAQTARTFDEFYRRHEPPIRRALVAALGPTDGSEAASRALAYGFEHWDRLSAMDNPAGYLYRVGRNGARTRKRPLPSLRRPGNEAIEFEPALPGALNRLTESQRCSVLLVVAWGYPLAEAADLLGVSVSRLRNHVARGMAHLRRTIGGTE